MCLGLVLSTLVVEVIVVTVVVNIAFGLKEAEVAGTVAVLVRIQPLWLVEEEEDHPSYLDIQVVLL